MKNVIVIGGHGKIARLATPLLLANGHQVTSLIRNPDHEVGIRAVGGVPLVADLEQLDTAAITELLQGHDVVVWSAGAGGGDPLHGRGRAGRRAALRDGLLLRLSTRPRNRS